MSSLNLNKFTVLVCFFAVFLYGFYLVLQYNHYFFEAQFLHIPFLKDIVEHQFCLTHFFTSYGEHLFPGYNLFLYLNYKFFKVSAFFDLIISFLTSVILACLLSYVAFKKVASYLLRAAIFFLVLTPVQNAMYGMALAAQFSTLVLSIIAYLIFIKRQQNLTTIIVLFFIYTIFFAGAYAIGALGILGVMLLCSRQANIKETLIIIVSMVMFYVMYYFILKTVSNHSILQLSQSYHLSIKNIVLFMNLMFASSFIGKAFFEQSHHFLAYHLIGLLVFSNIIFIFRNIFLNRDKLVPVDFYFISLLAYSLINILVVSIARNTNGMEGALGNWYQAHLRFIPVALIYFYSRFYSKYWALHALYMLVFFAVAFLGYYAEFIKGKYVPAWRDGYRKNIANYLNFANHLEEQPSGNQMLWDDHIAYEGIVFMYENNLSYFNTIDYLNFSGITDDNWIVTNVNKYIDIYCPASSSYILIKFDSFNQRAFDMLSRKYDLVKDDRFPLLSYKFEKKIKHLRLDMSHLPVFKHNKNLDDRHLIIHVNHLVCV